ncbi:hypothetical protein Tco_0187983, partial [Tanacetum coccineum]
EDPEDYPADRGDDMDDEEPSDDDDDDDVDEKEHYHLLFMRLRCLRFVCCFEGWTYHSTRADLYGFTDMLEAAPGGDYRSAESRLSEAEAVSRDPKDSEEPQGSDDRAIETAGTC